MTTPILTKPEVDAMYVECHKGLSIDRHKFADLLTVAVLAKLAAMNEPVAQVTVGGPVEGVVEWVGNGAKAGAYLYTYPPAAQDCEHALRNLLMSTRPHVLVATTRYSDGTGGSAARASAKRLLERIDAAMKGTP